MTRDHRRKKAVRAQAAATGRSYLDAATSLRSSRSRTEVLAARLRDDLVIALETAGWPVEIEHSPQGNALPIYAGPAEVQVGRAGERSRGATGDEHPDDPKVFDLHTPLQVTVTAPLIIDYSEKLQRVVGVDAHEISGDRPVAEIIEEIDRVIADARRRDVADLSSDVECGICGDPYPAEGLRRSTRVPVSVCPSCAFDGDLLGPRPAQLTFDLDRAAAESLATPAGWAGAQALLCCLGEPDLPACLATEWKANVSPLSRAWTDPGLTWVWLPPADQRPAALAHLGCGASLSSITAALDNAHPDLRTASREDIDAELDDFLDDEYGDERDDDRDNDRNALRVPEAIFTRIWPAAVAYTIGMLTQQAERPQFRSPWHLVQSFEMPDWVDALGATVDHLHVETVLVAGIHTIRAALDPREPE